MPATKRRHQPVVKAETRSHTAELQGKDDLNAVLVASCVRILSRAHPRGMSSKELSAKLQDEGFGSGGISSVVLSTKLNALFRKYQGDGNANHPAGIPIRRKTSTDLPKRLIYTYCKDDVDAADEPVTPPAEDDEPMTKKRRFARSNPKCKEQHDDDAFTPPSSLPQDLEEPQPATQPDVKHEESGLPSQQISQDEEKSDEGCTSDEAGSSSLAGSEADSEAVASEADADAPVEAKDHTSAPASAQRQFESNSTPESKASDSPASESACPDLVSSAASSIDAAAERDDDLSEAESAAEPASDAVSGTHTSSATTVQDDNNNNHSAGSSRPTSSSSAADSAVEKIFLTTSTTVVDKPGPGIANTNTTTTSARTSVALRDTCQNDPKPRQCDSFQAALARSNSSSARRMSKINLYYDTLGTEALSAVLSTVDLPSWDLDLTSEFVPLALDELDSLLG